ncbi:MAG: amidohydrolase family protein, partial [Gemmatimonadetes bacterium]|nr:amidohydrolase family protein [Gemmatimonadota bacterium]
MSARGKLFGRWLRLATLVACLAGFPAGAAGQDLAVTGGTVHTVTGDVLEGATVLVRDGVIAAVGTDVEVPAGVPTLDATGRIVTPGLFDATTSLGLVEVGMVSSTVDARLEGDPVRAAFDVVDGINPRSVLIPVNRAAGLTTALSAPAGGLISGQAAIIDLAGSSVDEMVVRTRAAMVANYSAGAAGGARGGATLRLREVLEDARFWHDHRADFSAGRTRELSASRLDLEALGPVLAGRIPLIVGVHRASDIEAVLRIADDYGLDLLISGGSEAWMVADRIASAGVPVILKPLNNSPAGFDRLGSRFDNAALLHRAGVEVIVGSFNSHNARWLLLEAGNAVRFGLPWDAALRAVTLAPAEALGVADRYGSLEPGKVGNLVVWTGDPFELSAEAEAVVIRGEATSLDHRQLQLFRRYRDVNGQHQQS